MGIRTYVVAFAISLLVSFAITPLIRRLALRFGLLDRPVEARKIHTSPIPRVGGIGIAIAFFVPIVAAFFYENAVTSTYLKHSDRVIGLVVGAVLMVGLGLVDDVRGLSPRVKFVGQILVASVAYFLGYQISRIALPFGIVIQLGMWSYFVTVLWIVGIVNAINLIDGLDGLATGVSLFTVVTLLTLSVINHNVVAALTSVALAGALLGFLRYNFNPATIFMGDSGSLFVGYILAVTSISGAAKSETVVSLLIPLLALGLPVMDTALSFVRRIVAGRHPFAADRQHMHYRLVDRGLSQKQAVLILYAACAALAVVAVSLVYIQSTVSAIILGVVALSAVGFARALGYLSVGEISRSFRYGLRRQQRLRAYLEAIRDAAGVITQAPDAGTILDALVALGHAVDADDVRLEAVVIRDGEPISVHLDDHLGNGSIDDGERVVAQPLEWVLGDGVEIHGSLQFSWSCHRESLMLTEESGYLWIGLLVRDRLLELHRLPGDDPATPQAAPEQDPHGGDAATST